MFETCPPLAGSPAPAGCERTVKDRVILDLCAGTGAWSRPYVQAGYIVKTVSLPEDVRLMRPFDVPVHGILAAPPCTDFARCGARWWESKGNAALLTSLSIVDACLRAVFLHKPNWWAL